MNQFDYKSCCFYGTWGILFAILFALITTLLAGGAEMYRHNNKDNTMPINMVPTECRLQSYEIYECKDGTWMATYNKGRVVESPFASRPSPDLAHLAALAYPVNASYPCMCNIALQTITPQCDAWNACVLNVNLTHHLQMTGLAYVYGGNIAVVVGSILLVLIVTATILMLIMRGCFACCCKDAKGQYAKFVLIGEGDE